LWAKLPENPTLGYGNDMARVELFGFLVIISKSYINVEYRHRLISISYTKQIPVAFLNNGGFQRTNLVDKSYQKS